MRDDDELSVRTQLLERVEQPGQVHVIQRSLHLVHHVERARTCGEDGEQQRQRGQRSFAAGQQAQLLDALAGRAGLHQYAGGQQIVRVLQPQPAGAAREQRGEHLLERGRRILERAAEHLHHRLVQVADQRHQVVTAVHHVVALVVQVPVAGLQRLILLGRQRVDLAERRQVALRLLQPLDLFGAHIRHRAVCRGRIVGPVRVGLVRTGVALLLHRHRSPVVVQYRHRLVGTIRRNQLVQSHADVVRHLLRQLPVCGGQSLPVHIQLVFASLQFGHTRFDPVALDPQPFQLRIMAGGRGLKLLAAGDHLPDALRHQPRHGVRVGSDAVDAGRLLATTLVQRLQPRASFGGLLRVVMQQPRLAVQRFGLAFLLRPRDPGRDLAFAGLGQVLFQLPFAVGQIVEVDLFAGGGLRRGQGPVQIVQFEPVRLLVVAGCGDSFIHRRDLTGEVGDTIGRAAQRLLRLLDPQPDFGAPLRCRIDGEPRLIARLARPTRLLIETGQLLLELGHLMQRLVAPGRQRQVALRQRRAAERGHAGDHHLAIAGHRTAETECAGRDLLRLRHIVHGGDVGEQQPHRIGHAAGLRLVRGVGIGANQGCERNDSVRIGRCLRPNGIGIRRNRLHADGGQHHGLAEFVGLGLLQRVQHLVRSRHHDGPRELVERVGDAFFPSLLDADEVGQPAQRTHGAVPFQTAGSVAALQRVLQRVGLGLQRDDASLDLAATRFHGVEFILPPGHGLARGL